MIHPKPWTNVPDKQDNFFSEYTKSEVAQRDVFRIFGIVQTAQMTEVIEVNPKSVMLPSSW